MLVGVGLGKSWLECVNDDMKKFGFKKRDGSTRIGTVWRSAIHMGTSKLCKHGKFDIKRIDR